MQAEPKLQAIKGDVLFFNAENSDLVIGDYVKLQNDSGTISTTVLITASARKFYRGMLTKDEPIENRLDLTKVIY